ncbi:MAG: hypothetical protein KGL39_17555 [Patescibacteria group bacterium]|nr:hypothetical protein [Patescibacteria group bacterium]
MGVVLLALGAASIAWGIWRGVRWRKYLWSVGGAFLLLLGIGAMSPAPPPSSRAPVVRTSAGTQTPSRAPKRPARTRVTKSHPPAPSANLPVAASSTGPVAAPAPLTDPSVVAQATAQESAYIEKAVLAAVGAQTNISNHPRRLLGLAADPGSDPSAGAWIVDATLEADQNLTSSMTSDGIEIASDKAFQALLTSDAHIYRLTLHWDLPLVDAYGKTSNGQVVQVSMTLPTAQKIDWSNFEFANLPTVADFFQESPSLR